MTTTDKNVGQRANLYACKAFTLIELLVVVLIIGILAAVAVPQYQKAVEKARLSEAFILGKHIRESEEMYYLANGSYTINFEDLGVETPSGYTLANDRLIKGDNVFHLENGINRRVIYYYGSTAKNNQHLAIFFWYQNDTRKGKIQCHPYTAHGTELCATLQY